MSQSCRMHFFFGANFDSVKFKLLFVCLLNLSVFYELANPKLYMKRYDRHNKRLWTRDFFNTVLSLVCPKIKLIKLRHVERSFKLCANASSNKSWVVCISFILFILNVSVVRRTFHSSSTFVSKENINVSRSVTSKNIHPVN